jgi:hypothetical protein
MTHILTRWGIRVHVQLMISDSHVNRSRLEGPDLVGDEIIPSHFVIVVDRQLGIQFSHVFVYVVSKAKISKVPVKFGIVGKNALGHTGHYNITAVPGIS